RKFYKKPEGFGTQSSKDFTNSNTFGTGSSSSFTASQRKDSDRSTSQIDKSVRCQCRDVIATRSDRHPQSFNL
uniref:Uncharacterized protein n=1 Tax=Cucumis melo TaxID=3656 RepID=A0A9I9DQ90_CUCME